MTIPFLLADAVTVTVDYSAVATTLLSALIIAVITLLVRGNRSLNQIVFQIGTNHPPEGILGRISKTETEIHDLREWAIRKGYDRRTNEPTAS